jgi:hypothetical protein
MTAFLSRREVLKALSVGVLAAPLALPEPQPGAPLYFNKDEFRLLDCLTELIIPADDHSPGAHEAGVAAFIDKTTAESYLPEDRDSWGKGLEAINQLSQKMNGKPFVEASSDEQRTLLSTISKMGDTEDSAPAKFFAQLKGTTAFAYYSSSIGIHKEMEYKGNVLLPQFVGYLPTDTLPPLSSL